MTDYNFIYLLKNIDLYEKVNLEKYTTMRLKVIGNIAIVKTVSALLELIKNLQEKKLKYNIVGWGANQVIHSTAQTLFIKLDFEFNRTYLNEVHQEYVLPASVPLNILTSHAQKFGLIGWEVFTGIPASLGGAIFMNAGTSLGEIGDLVKKVKVLSRNGKIREEIMSEKSFVYRGNNFVKAGEVIIEATLNNRGQDPAISEKIKDYINYRKRSQPLTTKNCGCVFKNFDDFHKAGQFIDLLGLKGLEYNGLKVSDVHANFIENIKDGSSDDFLTLTNLIKFELELFTGIKFELEAKIY